MFRGHMEVAGKVHKVALHGVPVLFHEFIGNGLSAPVQKIIDEARVIGIAAYGPEDVHGHAHGVPGTQPGRKGHIHGRSPIAHDGIGREALGKQEACDIRVAGEGRKMQQGDVLQAAGVRAAGKQTDNPAPYGQAGLAVALMLQGLHAQGEAGRGSVPCPLQQKVQGCRIGIDGRQKEHFLGQLCAGSEGCMHLAHTAPADGVVQPQGGIPGNAQILVGDNGSSEGIADNGIRILGENRCRRIDRSIGRLIGRHGGRGRRKTCGFLPGHGSRLPGSPGRSRPVRAQACVRSPGSRVGAQAGEKQEQDGKNAQAQWCIKSVHGQSPQKTQGAYTKRNGRT